MSESVVFGPVASRRLGRSLGVDLVPLKTCNYSCLYCQLGPTPKTACKRAVFVETLDAVRQVEEFLSRRDRASKLDVISLAGSGEPTLALNCGKVIRMIKDITPVPVAVITNGSLLCLEDVAEDLLSADMVMPSIDAVSEDVFEKINRPHPSLKLDDILRGIEGFSRIYRGTLLPEVMVLEGVNDTDEEMLKVGRFIEKLKPQRVDLNRVRGPVAIEGTRSPSMERMKRIASLFPSSLKVDIVGEDSPLDTEKVLPSDLESLGRLIVFHLERRPATLAELAWSLEMPADAVEEALRELMVKGLIMEVADRTDSYYTVAGQEQSVRIKFKNNA